MASQEKMFKGGAINRVDNTAGTVTLSTSEGNVATKGVEHPAGQELTLAVDADTTITVNRLYRNLAGLASGQKLAKVYYIEAAGGGKATVIHALDEELAKKQAAEAAKKAGTKGAELAKPAI